MNSRSFGCSFTAGTDLFSDDNTWPNIIAEKLGWLHINHAEAGIGNLRIAESVLTHANSGDFCVVNWTWIDRFDFVDFKSEQWKSIRPTNQDSISLAYYRDLHSQYRDMLVNLMYAVTVIDYFERNNISFIMTVIDNLWFEQVNPNWHDYKAITRLQNRLRPYVYFFQGMTFLDYSRDKGFPVSEAWHPMDLAHEAAAEIMLPVIASILHRA